MARKPRECYASAMAITAREAVAILRERLARTLPDREMWSARIRARVPAVLDVLVREFRVRRVVLFGSVAAGMAHAGSDIDLAVEGLSPADYFRALARAGDVAGRDVDLVRLEEVSGPLRVIIDSTGEVLLES